MSKVNSGQASSTLIPEYIGSDFDAVLTCVDNINDIKPVSENINDVVMVADNILNVNKVITSVNDVALVADNIDYVKDVAEGIEGLPVSGYIGDTPPTQPKIGATWYCTLDGRNYTWYEDIDSGQWVESSPQSTADDPHLAGNIFTLWKRSAAEAGYNLVAGSFEEGGVLTSSTDVLWHKGLDSIYSWVGAYPLNGYVVPPNTNPIGNANYVPRTDVVLRDELAGGGGAGMIGFSQNIIYAPETAGRRLANSVYTTDAPFLAKCDGVTDDSIAIQAAIDYAVSVGKQCVQPGISYVGSQVVAKGEFVGFGPEVSGFVSNEPIYALKTSSNPVTKRLSGISVKSTATTQASCNLRGLDTTGETPHFTIIENVAFERLLQAIKIDPYFYSNTFRNITCFKCGTPTQWAIEYVDSGRGDGANNILWDGLSITSDLTWLARGLKVSDAWDTTINHIHLENLGDYAAEFGGRSVSINGGYIEQHETLGTGIFTSNKVRILSQSVTFSGVLVNAKIESASLVAGGVYRGCTFNDGGFVPTGAKLYDTPITGNRVSVILPFYDLSGLISVSRGSPVNIPFMSKNGTLRVNGNFSSVLEQAWPEGGLGELRFNGGDIALTTSSGYALHNASGLQLKPISGVQCGVRWKFPARFRQGLGQGTINKLSAWAIVKVVSASSTLQLSFGFGGSQFESPEKLVGTADGGAVQWALLIVDDVSPYSDYVTFNLNRVGSGAPPTGSNEYVMVDSFGVCANGIDYSNLFGSDNL